MGNYSLKNIMLGVGIGLVFSSVINISIGSRELTLEEIKKEAERHNLIVLSKEEILNSQTPEATPTSIPTPTPTQTAPSPKPTTPASTGKIKVNVISGMSSESISDLLKESGLIKDTKAFLKRLAEVDKDDKLKIGTFEIPAGSGYDDIIRILTK
ncbi:MAG TPA: hypothetical protein VEG39_17110 [Clostridia bacterium]|nr:hypothetical protein [Clostridia bacterium]